MKEKKDPFKATLYDKGYIGMGEYKSSIKGKQTKVYTTWVHMLRRCYDGMRPTYKDCLVSEEWLNFQTFAQWFEENYIEGFSLDKDLLVKNNKVYSSETCCFIPYEINNMFKKYKPKQDNLPTGVRKKGNKFEAQFSKGLGVAEYLGTFSTVDKAFKTYKKAKEEYTKEVANFCRDIISPKAYQAMINYKVTINN